MSATTTKELNTNQRAYLVLEDVFKELIELSEGKRELTDKYPLVLHSNMLRLNNIIKNIVEREEKLPLQYSDLMTGHLDDLDQFSEDLEKIAKNLKEIIFNCKSDSLEKILTQLDNLLDDLAQIVDGDGGE
jgi:hypothetical protein